MPKKSKVDKKEEIPDKNSGKAPIVMKETEEDLVFDAGFVNGDNFKEEVKKEAEKGGISKYAIAAAVFLLIGGGTAFATWYYARPEKTVPGSEEKIKTPPVVPPETEGKNPETTTPATAPTTEKKEITYTVKEGDAMSTIANANGMTSAELAAYNGITDVNSLHIGQVLKIPVK